MKSKHIIIISPFSKPLRNGEQNPKNYPYWEELVQLLRDKGCIVTQIGTSNESKIPGVWQFVKDATFAELEDLISLADTFISVDNFFQHLCHSIGFYGIVLWGQSDPTLFGYKENVNLLKSPEYLRSDQFDIWEKATFNKDAFVLPGVVTKSLEKILNN